MSDVDGLEAALTYWTKHLGEMPLSLIEFPHELRRTLPPPFIGASQTFGFSAEQTAGLAKFAASRRAPLYMAVLAGLKALLYRYTKHVRHAEKVAVALPLGRRDPSGSTLPIVTDLSGKPNFGALLDRVRETVEVAQNHDSVPFEAYVAKLARTTASHRIRVAFALADQLATLEPTEHSRWPTRYDLSFSCEEREGRLTGTVVYNSNVFDAPTITQLLIHLRLLLEDAIARPSEPIPHLRFLPASERRQVLCEPSVASAAIQARCIHEMIEEHAAATPDVTAVAYKDQRLTFGELNARANQLARHLVELGVGPEALVGVCLGRSMDVIPTLLGIMKVGAAYVPLDLEHPKERFRAIIHDSGMSTVVIDAASASAVGSSVERVVHVERDRAAIARQRADNVRTPLSPDHLAYVMYTVGAQGQAKGVMVTHRNLSYQVASVAIQLSLTSSDVSLLTSSISVSASARQYIVPLACGARVVVASKQELDDPLALAATVKKQGVSILNLVPSQLRSLASALATLDAAPKTDLLTNRVRFVLTASEALTPDIAASWFALEHTSTLMNVYGMTETTGVLSFRPISRKDIGTKISIAPPMVNAKLYILDDHHELVPIGIPGELYACGPLLARGYWKQEKTTVEKFQRNPFDADPGARIYRTGDRARMRIDGTIELLGRIDDEAKIQGFKVIPDEVKAVLAQHPSIQDLVVALRDSPSGEKRLVAFVVPRPKTTARSSELREFLRERLPDYMVPTTYIRLDELPLLPSGRVDRRALPSFDEAVLLLEEEFVAPRTAVEKKLAEIWEAALATRPIGINDHFFELGGDSLKAMQIFLKIRVAYGAELPLRKIFDEPTIAELAPSVEAGASAASQRTTANS